MKKVLLLLSFLVAFFVSNAQYPVVQFLGRDSALVDSRGGLKARLINYAFTDTTQANTQRISQYAGALIYTTSGGDKLWLRNSTATAWDRIGTSSGGGGGIVSLGASAYGLIIQNDSTYKADTIQLSTRLWRQKGIDSVQGNVTSGLALKLNLSDTASMLTGYTRVQRFLDSLVAIRTAFPRFGTSTDATATAARLFDANSYPFTIKNINYSGSGFFTGSTASPYSTDAGAYYSFIDEMDGAPGIRLGVKNSIGWDGYIGVATTSGGGSLANIILKTYITGDQFHEIELKSDAIYIRPNNGNFIIDSLNIWSGPLSGGAKVLGWSGDYVYYIPVDSFLTVNSGIPSSRTLSINGISYDLTADRSWTISGDFYTLDGTFSGNRRGNLNGYRLTFDSGQVRYRDTLTSSTGKLYGGIYDYGKSGVEHINYDSLLTAYQSINTVTGVKFGVKDQNNLDTNNYIQVDASGIYSVTDSVPISDSSSKIATTKWVKDQLYGTGGGASDGYVDGATFSTSTNTLTLTQTGASDVTVRIPPSYLQNPIDQDSLIKEVNDSVGRIKAVKVVSDHPEILVTTTRNDSINTHTLSKIYISEPIATFSAGAGFVADTALFTDSTLYGSFYTDQDSFYIDRVIVVLKGQAGDSLGIQIIHNDSINVTGTVVSGGTIAVNSRTTGNTTTVSTNQGIPPNSWVWVKSPTVIAGKRPEYLSITLVGYKKWIAP